MKITRSDKANVGLEVNRSLHSLLQTSDCTGPMLELERYSKLRIPQSDSLDRFISNAKTKIKTIGELTPDKLFDAKKYWIKTTQQQRR